MQVKSQKQFDLAVAKASELARGEGADAARDFISGCEGEPYLLKQFRASAYLALADDLPSLLDAEELWREIGPERAEVAFQLGLTLQRIVALSTKEDGVAAVIEHEAGRLRETRVLYERAGAQEDAEPELRLLSWVNAGNSFSTMGRDVDALRCYGEALSIDPGFGMALGNRGMALLKIAPFMGGHTNHLIEDAALLLDRALEDEKRILQSGEAGALETFRRSREAIKGGEPQPHAKFDGSRFADPHLQWAYECGLLLHVSPECARDDDSSVDPLHLGAMKVGIDRESQRRLKRLRDAFNTVKQDFISARYTLWLASDPKSPIRGQAQEISARGLYIDTLAYGRWGVQTGMAMQAFTVATNTLDKIAGLLHLYFNTDRKAGSVHFNGMWHQPRRKGEPPEMEPNFAKQLSGGVNRGVLALCDLSLDVAGEDRETTLKQLVGHRHTATHRFLVAHDMVAEEDKEDRWLTRLLWPDLLEGAIAQLGIARAALVYLARAIASNEEAASGGQRAMPMPSYEIEEFDRE